MNTLTGKIAVVTGSSRGIGRAIALKLAAEGASVILSGRDLTLLESAVTEIQENGGKTAFLALDLREPDAAFALAAFAREQFGAIDILINNAGATRRGDFLTLSDADFEDGFVLKFYGAVRLIRAAWPDLKAAHGSILNIVGVGGRTPGAQFAIGGSVNSALLSLTKSLAETGLEDGIQVNALNPGPVRTNRLTKRLEEVAAAHHLTLEAAAVRFAKESQVTRLGEPEDIAALAAFIVSPAGRLLHGSLIDMDGGQTKTI